MICLICDKYFIKNKFLEIQVKKAPSSSSGKATNGNGPNISKVNSEVSADGGDNEKKKQCCVILWGLINATISVQ